jgi:replicative superfamily II helicase
MKNKLARLPSGLDVASCYTCHQDTINDGWCPNCTDDASVSKFTLNPIQTEVLRELDANPELSFLAASKTGTGKSLMAYTAIRSYYKTGRNKKIFFLQPLKQIAHEKVDDLKIMFSDHSVLELTGDTSAEVGYGKQRNEYIRNHDIIVMSYEMFDSLTRKPEIYTEINNVGMLIVDEIHSIGDHSRGGKLDGALTRFFLRASRLNHKIQIIGLSATFDNIQDLKEYFDQFGANIKIITSVFSPIKVHTDPHLHTYDRDSLAAFLELISFYMSKKEVTGGIMCMQLSIPGCNKLADAVNSLFGAGTARVHYSELQRDDKYQVVDDFNSGKFKVLCCTPTLLAGVNVAAAALILNLSFFNPIKMDADLLPATSIKQATGRVGRVPRYKEGWVSYVCNARQYDDALEVLNAPNTIYGALNSALYQVLNIEVSLRPQTEDELKEWYRHTYSGFSKSSSDDLFHEHLNWLVSFEYIKRDDNSLLTSLPKGKACTRFFVNPPFFEQCKDILTKLVVTTTEGLSVNMESLFSQPDSPCNWNERKSKQLEDYCNFNWMIGSDGLYDYNRNQPKVQWAAAVEFAMHGIVQTAQALKMTELAYNAKTIETCMSEGLIPLPLINLKHRLDSAGIPHAGNKYLLYLRLNNVSVDLNGALSGPEEFKTPTSSFFKMEDDTYYDIRFGSEEMRYAALAKRVVTLYGTPVNQTISSDDEW